MGNYWLDSDKVDAIVAKFNKHFANKTYSDEDDFVEEVDKLVDKNDWWDLMDRIYWDFEIVSNGELKFIFKPV